MRSPGPRRACRAKPWPCGSACPVPPAPSPSAPSARVLLLRTGIAIPLPCTCWWDGGKCLSPPPHLPPGAFLRRGTQGGHLASPGEEAPGVSSGGCFWHRRGGCCPPSWHISVGPTTPPTSSICREALAKPVNHPHIKAPAAQALTAPAAGSERTVPAQMFSSSFSQLQRAVEFTRKPREGKEFWPAEGRR